MELAKLGVAKNVAETLVAGMTTGEYSLLLGAGFSAGAKGGDGTALPSAWTLAKNLNDEFDLNAEEAEFTRLHQIYDDALNSSWGRRKVLSYIRRRFTNCRPTWQGQVLDFDWSRIWTLNIDDVLEVAAESQQRKWRSESWSHTDGLRATDPKSGNVQVIHLHGRAASISGNSSDLVFSLPEYSNASRGRGDWLAEFWSSWLQRPFVVVGAKLLEEFDLAGALGRGTQARATTGFPTIAVLRDVTARERSRLERNGVLVVQSSGEAFFSALSVDLAAHLDAHPELAAGLSPAQLAAFNAQFEVLASKLSRPSLTHDFYSGDEPRWADIQDGRDAVFKATSRCSAYLANSVDAPRVAFISGRPGGGKTGAILRIAATELSRARAVAIFRGEKELDVDAATAWLRAKPKCALFFDNAADHAGSIGVLLRRIHDSGLDASVVVAERAARSRAVISDLGEKEDIKIFEYGLIREEDVSAVVASRRKVARLGIGTSWSDREWKQHFLSRHRGDLFSALSEIEAGAGFYGRMDAEVQKLAARSNLAELQLLLAVAIVHRSGYSLPIRTAHQILASCGGSAGRELFSEDIRLLVELDRMGVRLRHRMLADRYIGKFSGVGDRNVVSLAIARSLGALLTPQSMGAKKYEYLVLRALMDQEHVQSLLESVAAARHWFAELENVFEWNGRYWDQRALLESSAGAHAAAYSYARKSVELHRHPFSLTTLGTVRCRAALETARTDFGGAWELFAEGNAALMESEAMAASRGAAYEHPFVKFFTTAIELLEAIPSGDSRRNKLNDMRAEWERLALKRHDAPGISRVMQVKSREWARKFLKTGLVKRPGVPGGSIA